MSGLQLVGSQLVGLEFDGPLEIDWSVTMFYNTLMAIGAGAGLAMIAGVMRDLLHDDDLRPKGWSVNFFIVGIIVFATGIHMVLTWPLSPRFAYDNIIFGEPMAMFGAILLGLARYFHVRSREIEETSRPIQFIAADLRGIKYFLYGAGGSVIAIAAAALTWNLFIAPSEEPIAGLTADWGIPWATNVPIALIFAAIGVCAILMPGILQRQSVPGAEVTALDLRVVSALKWLGITLIVIGVIVTYTHIGMVINTSNQNIIPH